MSRPDEYFHRQRDHFPTLTPPHSAERPLHSLNSPALSSPSEEKPRILFRSVDRNKNLAGNKISTARCRDDQMPSPPHSATLNALPETLTETLPAAIPTRPKLFSLFSADGMPPHPGGPWTPIQRYHLEKLLAHGCVINTEENARGVEQVWLKISPEEGGGYGFGLTKESVMRYVMHQSGRFNSQTARRRRGRQMKWMRWVLENRRAATKGDFGAGSGRGNGHGSGLEIPVKDSRDDNSILAAAEAPCLSRSTDSLPLTSHWSPPFEPQSLEKYEERPWWQENKLNNSPLRPAMSVLSTTPTPGVQEVLEAIRAVTAKEVRATGNPEANFPSDPLTLQSNEPVLNEVSSLTALGINTYPQGLSIVSSHPMGLPLPSTATAHQSRALSREITHPQFTTTPIPAPATQTPFSCAVTSPSQACPPAQNQVNSRSSTHLHLKIHVTRGQHQALLDQLLDMPGDIMLHNPSLSNGRGDGEQVIFIRVEVPKDYQKFMMMVVRKMPGVREVVVDD
ncbi:hypothetical protein L211DRAFT_850348 [Terfezia boudieri ATCC MYA-4762]|uniref:Uncharacterized protein n=1 Tax=Terfezia boudieri ATCC MYA-4762 TaxID=1051890 RepID=A0A3N4LJB5_9PEZI|nr:hypothetical protein L211DRAFT_850348 [Terfezia boudieri ATCC MYA-4762]